MKVIKTAAMIVGAVALVATGVGAVVGGAAFLAATGVSLATVTMIGTVAGLVGTIANMISPPKAAKGTIGGSQTAFKLDPNAGIPYLMGRTYSGGNIFHRDSWGTDNQYQGFCVTYSGAGTLQAFESFQIDNSVVGLGGGGAATGSLAGWFWNRLTLPVLAGAAALSSPVAGFPGVDASFKVSGHATAVEVYKFDVKNGKKWSAGIPKNGVVAIGERVYDPRQDSTYPGGVGPCRAGQEATYVGGAAAENPWLHALTWGLGRFQNGKRVLGVGQRIETIDVAAFVDAANVADANGWKLGGVVYSIDDKWDVMRQMAQAGGGQILRLGARLSCFVNAPKVSLATVTDDDLIARANVSASQTYRDRLNGMIPKYRSEGHGWEMTPASVVRVASYVTADGEEKTREWPLPLVQQLTQAGQLTAYELVNRREFGPINLPLFLRFMGYKPGDALNLNINSLGLVGQQAIVRKRQIDPQGGSVQLSCISETPAKHPFALGTTSVAPPLPSLSVPDESVVAAPQASDWQVAGGSLENAGTKQPAIILTGDVRNPIAEAFLVELRAAASPNWSLVGTYPAKATRVDIVNVAAGASYYVAVSFVRRGVVGERLQLGPVAAGDLVAGDALALGGVLAAELLGSLSDIEAGKAKPWFQATPPTAAESAEADIWFDTDDGNLLYRRLPGTTGRLSIGGTVVTYGGSAILYRPWAPASDQRIAQALAQGAAAILAAQGAQATANSAIDSLEALADDGILTGVEKKQLVLDDSRLQGAWSILDAQAATFGVVAERTAAATARTNWIALRNALAPAWNDTSQDTVVNRASFVATLTAYDAALTTLQKAISAKAATTADWTGVTGAGKDQLVADAATAKANAATALTQIGVIQSDGYLSTNEKPDIIRQRTDIEAEYGGLVARAAGQGVPSAAYQAAYAALIAYLNGLAPAWNNTALDTAVVPATFNAKFADYYYERTALLNATADLTVANQITATVPSGLEVPADYTGAIAAGTLPKVVIPIVKRGGTDVTTTNPVTYALSGFTGGCTIGNTTVDNGVGSATKGQVTVGAGWTGNGGFVLYISYAGTLVGAYPVSVSKKLGPPPSGGGSGSSGYVKTGNFSAVGKAITTTSFVEVGKIPNMAKAAGETLYATFTGAYNVNSDGSARVYAKWQYAVAGSGSWTDFPGGAATGAYASQVHNPPPPGHTLPSPDDPPEWEIYSGDVACNRTAAPSDGNYDVRLVVALVTAGPSVTFGEGTAALEIKV